jgi:hypothetical protein
MASVVRELNVTWCPSCGQTYEVPVDRIIPSARPTLRESPLECPRCGCRGCRPRDKPRLSRPFNGGLKKPF